MHYDDHSLDWLVSTQTLSPAETTHSTMATFTSSIPALTISYNNHLELMATEREKTKDTIKKLKQENDKLKAALKEAKEATKEETKKAKEAAALRLLKISNTLNDEITRLKTVLKEKKQELRAEKKQPKNKKRGIPPKSSAAADDDASPSKKKAKKSQPPNKHEIKWNDRLEQLVQYKEQYGHCNPSRICEYPDFPKIGIWVSDQRTQHRFLRLGKPNNMTPERIQRLTAIGFQWTMLKHAPLTFDERLKQLETYKAQHGHCNVPQKCDEPEGLGGFVTEARRMYKNFMAGGNWRTIRIGREEAQDRINRMTAMGFDWSLRNRGGGSAQKRTNSNANTYWGREETDGSRR